MEEYERDFHFLLGRELNKNGQRRVGSFLFIYIYTLFVAQLVPENIKQRNKKLILNKNNSKEIMYIG